MSALNFARQAFSREKPHSSITDWVEILTSSGIEEEAYDGIPELVDSINLQASGPAEAARALRKKIKHGNPHNQYRSLVILKALVENSGQKFQSTFAEDGQLQDALRHLVGDHSTDKRVKKKLHLVLASWNDRYKDDPSMVAIANLYKSSQASRHGLNHAELANLMGLNLTPEELARVERPPPKKKDKALAKEKEKEKDKAKKEENKNKKKKAPFNFETDKPIVLSSIVEASQASSNLVNAITLVNLATDSLETNERVQECLEKAKAARKSIVRYIQLVENEEVIGTLIETNDRIMSALEMYESLASTSDKPNSAEAITSTLAATTIDPIKHSNNPYLTAERAEKGGNISADHPTHIHPDLEDLSFGALGNSSSRLPAPLRPSTMSDDEQEVDQRGSLSDFSDYESSDEETHKNNPGPSKRAYVTVSDDEDAPVAVPSKGKIRAAANPFADPFADT